MSVQLSRISLPGSHLAGQNPLPIFRDPQHNKPVHHDGSFISTDLEGFGYEIGSRVLPYCLQDRYSRSQEIISLKTVVLENDFLRAEFLTEYGGRLYSLFDKENQKELLFKNPVFQPANLANRNAWFSGGIEWNIGQYGHSFLTCEPLYVARCEDENGESFVRLYEYERCKGVYFQIDFHLPQKAHCLGVYVRIVNDTDKSVPMYWWTNTAVTETEGLRIFSSTEEVIFIRPETIASPDGQCYGRGRLPALPTMPELDASYPLNSPYANEYFFQTAEGTESPWEAAIGSSGYGLFERSTSVLKYRKMFCWGTHEGGRRWRDFLSAPGKGNYVEIQAGLMPTQVHGQDMPGHSVWDFTQVFAGVKVPEVSIGGDYAIANGKIALEIEKQMPENQVLQSHEIFQRRSENQPSEILSVGSGWGYLEEKRRRATGEGSPPKGLVFVESSLGSEQAHWIELLETGRLKEIGPKEIPTSWMIDPKWREWILKASSAPEGLRASESIHLGVMLYEAGDRERGIQLWEESLEKIETVIAYRNLAEAKRRTGEVNVAAQYLSKALLIGREAIEPAMIEEYMTVLIEAGQHAAVLELSDSLGTYDKSERIQMLMGRSALECGKPELVEDLLEAEFATIREGETLLTDLWYRLQADKIAKEEGIPLSAALMDVVKKTLVPPAAIDFRMKTDE